MNSSLLSKNVSLGAPKVAARYSCGSKFGLFFLTHLLHTLHNCTAVSYTHLDVYKRQVVQKECDSDLDTEM